MSGYILLHRKMLENAIFYKPNYYQIWCYILLKVNHKDHETIWNGEKKIIKRGSGIFSQKKISQDLGISIGSVHNCLKYLKSESQIEIKTTSKFTEIQVVKWEDYQDIESIIENRMKTERKQNETNKHDKHDKQLLLADECHEFVKVYGQGMIDKFLNYWQEKNKKGVEKWKLQKTWETKRRLETWKKNDFGYKKPNQIVNGQNGVIV